MFIRQKLFAKDLDRLARRAQRGDVRAADDLYAELIDKVFGFCMNRVGRRETAEDLTQEVFLKLVVGLPSFDAKRGRFVVWFWQLARNVVVDYYRRSKDIPFSDIGDDAAIDEHAPKVQPASLDAVLGAERLATFVGTLSADEQELFRLRYVAELPYGDIAEILEKSEGALRVAASRLKNKIRNHLTLSDA